MAIQANVILQHRNSALIAVTIAVFAVIAGRSTYKLLSTANKSGALVYKGPKPVNRDEIDSPPYPSDALPGARDVDTPYGSVRVNEWGPEDGRKVLFIHGISTPSISCAHMALQLAEQDGCRVMMFDLFGRGYSDSPDPADIKQDIRLFTSQILLVLASSPLAWTGQENRFTLVGYSLGGGIAASFVSFFPQLVNSLIVIAPAGLMRASRIQLSSRLIYGGFLPDLLRNHLVRSRIAGSGPAKKPIQARDTESKEADVGDNPEFAPGSLAPLFPNSTASAADTVAWQLKENAGFLTAFISSIRYAPISNEHDRWRLIASRLDAQRSSSESGSNHSGLREGKVLLIFGESDAVVVPTETIEDALGVLGERNVQVEVLEGGHDVVITNAQACVSKIRDFWRSGTVQ